MIAAFEKHALRHPLKIVLLAASLIILPLFFYITPALNDNDLLFYKLALTEFSAQFWHGYLTPRWLFSANDGLGSPVFIFLGPGAYYPAVLLAWLDGMDADGSIRFIISVLGAHMLSGLLCYRWLCRHYGAREALIITVLFLTIPYKIHEIYVRAEMAEFWSLTCIFLLFNVLDGWIQSPNSRIRLVQFACASAWLILTHLPTFITFGGVPFLYVFFLARKTGRWRLIARLVSANLLAVTMAAFYLLPLWQNKEFINSAYYFSGQYTFAQNFLVHPNEYYCLPYFILAAFAAYFSRRDTDQRFLKLQLVILGIIAFMVLPVSSIVWQWVYPLHFLQFPFRFLNIALLPFACVGCYLMLHTRLRPYVIVLWSMGLFFHFYVIYTFTPHAAPLLAKIPEHKLVLLSEYRTAWEKDYQEVESKILSDEYKSRGSITAGTGDSVILMPSPYGILKAEGEMRSPGQLRFTRFYFPGMEVVDMQAHKMLALQPDKEGLFSVQLPAGKFTVETRLGWLSGERTGLIISLGAVFAAILFGILGKRSYTHEKTLSLL